MARYSPGSQSTTAFPVPESCAIVPVPETEYPATSFEVKSSLTVQAPSMTVKLVMSPRVVPYGFCPATRQ